MSEKGVEKGGILCVFSLFQSAFPAKKARCSAADDLFRGSQINIVQAFFPGNGDSGPRPGKMGACFVTVILTFVI